MECEAPFGWHGRLVKTKKRHRWDAIMINTQASLRPVNSDNLKNAMHSRGSYCRCSPDENAAWSECWRTPSKKRVVSWALSDPLERQTTTDTDPFQAGAACTERFPGSLVIPRDYFTSTERLLAFQNIVSFILGSLSIGYFHTSLTTRVAFWKPVGQDRAERIWISLLTGTRNAKRDAMHIKWLDL